MADSTPSLSRTKRRYGTSCELCKKRKRKCPGRDSAGVSLCTHCAEVGVACVFPSMSIAPRMSKRKGVQSSEAVLTLQKELDELKSFTLSLAEATDDRREELLTQWIARSNKEKDDKPTSSASPESSTSNSASPPQLDDNDDDLLSTLGNLHLSRLEDFTSDGQDSTGDNNLTIRWVDLYLSQTFLGQADVPGVTPDESQLLLSSFWCWQNPRYGVCDRALFEKGVTTGDPALCSPFLIWSLYAHTARHIPSLTGRVEEFAARACILLSSVLSRPSSIPSIQGLIILASHLSARSKVAQAWNLTGSATAMIREIMRPHGLEAAQVSEDELPNLLHRLFWATFGWDQTLSLSVSRRPFLSLVDGYPPFPVIQELDSADLWVPFLPPGSENALAFTNFPAYPSFESQVFQYRSQAFRFIHGIISELYGPRAKRPLQARPFVTRIQDEIQKWQSELPTTVFLKLDESNAPLTLPPHIMQFNILVRLIWLLLYRPFYTIVASDSSSVETIFPDCHRICEAAAVETHAMLTIFASLFPLTRISYVYLYAAYSSATIDLTLAARNGSVSEEIMERLKMDLQVLDVAGSWAPGMRKSIENLRTVLMRLLHNDRAPNTLDFFEGAGQQPAVDPIDVDLNMMMDGPWFWPTQLEDMFSEENMQIWST